MTAFMKSIHRMEHRFDLKAEHFAFHHPYLSILTMFIGMPVFILLAVTVSTTLITVPVAWFCGWL